MERELLCISGIITGIAFAFVVLAEFSEQPPVDSFIAERFIAPLVRGPDHPTPTRPSRTLGRNIIVCGSGPREFVIDEFSPPRPADIIDAYSVNGPIPLLRPTSGASRPTFAGLDDRIPSRCHPPSTRAQAPFRVDGGRHRETISSSVAGARLRQLAKQLDYCFQRRRVSNFRLGNGNVEVNLRILSDGTLESAEIASSAFEDEDLHGCLLSRFRRLKMPEALTRSLVSARLRLQPDSPR